MICFALGPLSPIHDWSFNSLSGKALLFFREPVRKHAQMFLRIQVARLRHLSISSYTPFFTYPSALHWYIGQFLLNWMVWRFLPVLTGAWIIFSIYKKTQSQPNGKDPGHNMSQYPQEQCKFSPIYSKCKLMVSINGKGYSHFLPVHL
jgi:hypothetical protein